MKMQNNYKQYLIYKDGDVFKYKKNCYSNTRQKHISIITHKKHYYKYYHIQKQNYFSEFLRCDEYSLDDAINLRDALISMSSGF